MSTRDTSSTAGRWRTAAETRPARSRVSLTRLVTRLAAIGDQVVVSLTNFGLTIAIGRAFSAEEFASYGIGLSIGLMVQALQRHAITIPLMLRPSERLAQRHSGILGAQLLMLFAVVAIGLAALAAAHLSDLSRYGQLIASAGVVCLIVYIELEFSRAFLIKTGKPWLLLAGACWYALVSLALSAAALTHRIGYETLLLVLGGAMMLHALSLIAISGRPDWRKGRRLLALDIRRYGGWSAAATLTYAGYNHVPLLLLGAFTAPIHAAAFVATRSLLQPLQIILRGLDLADKSLFAEAAKRPFARDTQGKALMLAALYALVALVFGATAGLFADRLIALAYGPKFSGFGSALLAWVPAYVLLSVSMPLESLIYARRDFRPYFLLRGLASAVAIAAAFPLMMLYAETGAILACALGWLIAVAGTFIRVLRTTRRSAPA